MGLEDRSPVARSRQLDHSSSGTWGAQCCHASTTSAALLHGQSSVQSERVFTGWAWKVSEVTTPKFPPPPPRKAQKSSGSWLASQVRRRPSATTTCAESRLSQV